MNEQSVASARASVLVYDASSKKWVPSGSSTGLSKVHIYHHAENNTFRVVGRKVHDHEVVINCSILKGLKYFQATPTFHQWRDNSQIHGLNFASREDAETFALAMERVLDILGHSSVYMSSHRSPSQSQPLYQTIGHSGVSLDDYAEYRGWINNENGERKSTSEYGHYRSSNHASHSSHPNTPGSIPSPGSYSHHRASSAPSVSQQQLSVIPSPQTSVPPPPPPPPPPPSNSTRISGIATLPRLNLQPTVDHEPTEVSLAAALATAKLKKTPTKGSDSTANDSKHTPAIKAPVMACMLDEMTRTLARRRAQTDSTLESENMSGNESLKNWMRQSSINGCSPNKNPDADSPQSLRRSDSGADNRSQILVDVCEIEKIKQEILTELRKEMNKMKQDIIDDIFASDQWRNYTAETRGKFIGWGPPSK